MTVRIETLAFEWQDPRAKDFLDVHGYVVVEGVLAAGERRLIAGGWDQLVRRAATRVGLSATQFVERFPQNRDLWRKQRQFAALLFDTPQATAARAYLGVSGVRLFHDHAVCKPVRGSGAIPWHQDSAYWPLDRAGLSLWTPVDAVGVDGGCLEVLDGSHRDGAGEPQDFLARASAIAPDDPRRVLLPVAAGTTVVLSGLTWHSSAPNLSPHERLAYLTLWVPATARFEPAHAAWHPTTAHIGVAAGERLDGDWFPLFGVVASEDEGQPVAFPPPAPTIGPSMFTASSDIAAQLAWLLGTSPRPLTELIATFSTDAIARRASTMGLMAPEDLPALDDVLSELALQDRVRRESVARDVYLRTVVRWWTLIGARIDEARRAG